jgi:Nbl1 / Borealin N terminal
MHVLMHVAQPVCLQSQHFALTNTSRALLTQSIDTRTVKARCRLVREEMESQKLALRAKFSVEKLKLPKAIRQMPLKQFLEEYGEDVQAVLHTAIQSTAASAAAADDDADAGEPRTVVKGSRDKRAGVAQTPGAAAGSSSTRAGFATR